MKTTIQIRKLNSDEIKRLDELKKILKEKTYSKTIKLLIRHGKI